MRTKLSAVVILFAIISQSLSAQLQNIPCTGYNADVVANGAGTSFSSTSTDIDANLFVFIDNTYKPGGSVCRTTNVWKTSMPTSGSGSDITYTLQASNTNNSLRVNSGNSATLNVTTPFTATNLYLLVTGGNGSCVATVTVTFQDNVTQTFTGVDIPDWCGGTGPVTGQFYRSLRNGSTSCSSALCPYMFEANLTITANNYYRKITSITITNGIGAGVANVFAVGANVTTATPPTCSAPLAQPSNLVLSATSSTVNGTFTASPSADSYLIVRSTSNTLSAGPVDNTSYPVGTALGGGIVVSYQSSNSFADSYLLNEGTIYYYYIFSANSNCTGGPIYFATNPLANSSTITASGVVTYTSTGTWTCPPGVTSIKVECYGGGGGGGYGNVGADGGAGGGGGGAYTKNTAVSVVAGTPYSLTVGSFGAAGVATSTNGGDGQNSSFDAGRVLAKGGKGGISGAGTRAGGTGGTAETPIGTMTSSAGGSGANGAAVGSGGGGSGAGTSGIGNNGFGTAGGATKTIGGGAGGAGKGANYQDGTAGSTYGGGGGGGSRNANGGSGANGAIIITCPCTAFYPSFNVSPPAIDCVGNSISYTTQMGASSYTWTIPGTSGTDYTITAGATTSNTITIKWLTAGSKTVTANYTISGCSGATPASATTVIKALPIVSATISGAAPCLTGSVTLNASSTIGGTSYNWYSAATGGALLGTGNSFSSGTISADSTFYLSGTANGCVSSSRGSAQVIISKTLTEWDGDTDNAWENVANWTNGVPCTSTKAIIPDVATVSYYPIISAAANCDTIVFESGAGVLGLQHLNYNKAFVNMTVRRDKWYTLTTPLKETFTGDYFFKGAPISLVRLFDDVDPDKGDLALGTWTRTFSNLLTPLQNGQGFAFNVQSAEWDRSGASPVKVTNSSDYTLTFPRTNADKSLNTEMVNYSSATGVLRTTGITNLSKNASYAYRFGAEDASNSIPSTISVSVKPGLNMIGNPLMTHLDFNAFQADNSGKISNKVKYWNGSSFDTFIVGPNGTISSSLGSHASVIIPPMQGFFVECTTGAATDVDINVASHFVDDASIQLRSCIIPRNRMHVIAETSKTKTSICIAKNEGASNEFGDDDATKLFSSLEDVPEVYTICNGKALAINQFENFPYTTPLSIKCAEKGIVKLKFYGISSFNGDAEVELINSRTGERIDLNANSEYDFNYDGSNASGELFLSFRSASISTEVENKAADNIQVYANGETLQVISSPEDLIQEVSIWNTAGAKIISASDLNAPTYSINLNPCSQFYIVKVTSNNKCRTTKVLIK